MTGPDAETRAAIAAVLGRYCHAIDRRRWEFIERCFHPDATYSFGPIDGSWREFVVAAQAIIDPLPMTHHQLGQTLYALDGDLIRTETYFTATHRVAGDAPSDAAFAGRGHAYQAVMTGRYVDAFALRDGAWRIARRTGMIDGRHDIALAGDAMPALGLDDPAAGLAI